MSSYKKLEYEEILTTLLAHRKPALQAYSPSPCRETCTDLKATLEAAIEPDTARLSAVLGPYLSQMEAYTPRNLRDALIASPNKGIELIAKGNTLVFRVEGLDGLLFKTPFDGNFAHQNRQASVRAKEMQAKYAANPHLIFPATQSVQLELPLLDGSIEEISLSVVRAVPADFNNQELLWHQDDFDPRAVDAFADFIIDEGLWDVKYANNPAIRTADGDVICLVDLKTVPSPGYHREAFAGLIKREFQPVQLGLIRSLPPRRSAQIKARVRSRDPYGKIQPIEKEMVNQRVAGTQRFAMLKGELLPKAVAEALEVELERCPAETAKDAVTLLTQLEAIVRSDEASPGPFDLFVSLKEAKVDGLDAALAVLQKAGVILSWNSGLQGPEVFL